MNSISWLAAYSLLRVIHGDQPELLRASVVLFGLGLENKHSTAFFLVSLTLGELTQGFTFA